MDINKKIFFILLLVGAGCQPDPKPRPTWDAEMAANPCAAHLHDLIGELLVYKLRHDEWPRVLSELTPNSEDPAIWHDPVTGLPYKYSPEGILTLGKRAHILVWEQQPCTAGIRWVILQPTEESGESQDLRVAPIPEKDLPKQIISSQ